MSGISSIQVQPGLDSDNVKEFKDSLDRAEQTFFAELCLRGPGPYADLQMAANAIDGLSGREKFYVRFVDSNFDGESMRRWLWFARRNANRKHQERYVSALVCEDDDKGFMEPSDVHVGSLAFMVAMWRGGSAAVMRRLERLRVAEKVARRKAMSDHFEAVAFDSFSLFKRTFKDVGGGAEGTCPNRGSKYFGRVMSRSYDQRSSGILVPR